MEIAINSIIEWLDDLSGDDKPPLDRILWISASGENCVTIRIDDDTALPVWQSVKDIEDALLQERALKRTQDPFAWCVSPSEDYLLKHSEHRDNSWEIIKDLVNKEPEIYDEKERGLLIRSTVLNKKTNKKSIYKYLNRYWTRGKTINALLPDFQKSGGYGKTRPVEETTKKRGRPSKLSINEPEKTRSNIDEDLKKIIRYSMNKYYASKQFATIPKAYNAMLQNHFNIGYVLKDGVKTPVLPPANEVPSIGQFKYWGLMTIDLEKLLKARSGDRGFALKHRAVLGESTQMAAGPGSVYQVDATVADVYVVNRLKRNDIIGRPIVYVCIDVFSRMIVGLYVGLEGPSWLGAMITFANTAESKIEYCARYGISISEDDWPCHYLPERLMADRGEFISSASDSLVKGLGVTIDNTPPYRADWKGIVEQYFRCLNLRGIKWVPGAVRKRERGEKDCRLDAQLDLEQFTKILIHNIIKHNKYQWIEDYPLSKEMIADRIDPVPMTLWEWGVRNRVGILHEATPDRVKLAVMPRDSARITTQGIIFKGVHYVCDRALREQWFIQARHRGRSSLEASYDPRNLDMIYLHLRNEPFEVCYLMDKDARFKGCTEEEIIDLQYKKSIAKDSHEGTRNQGQADCDAQVSAVLDDAARMKKLNPTTKSNHQRTLGIKDNRKEERDQRREEDAWQLGTDSGSPDEMALPPLAEQSEPEDFPSKKESFLNVLKQQRSKNNEESS